MVEMFGSIVLNCHNIWIIVLIVVIERVEKYSQTDPFIGGPKNVPVGRTFGFGVPEGLFYFKIILHDCT